MENNTGIGIVLGFNRITTSIMVLDPLYNGGLRYLRPQQDIELVASQTSTAKGCRVADVGFTISAVNLGLGFGV